MFISMALIKHKNFKDNIWTPRTIIILYMPVPLLIFTLSALFLRKFKTTKTPKPC